MSTINLTDRVALTTERAESSHGVPVLVVDGTAYGSGDHYGPALRAALNDPADALNWIKAAYTGYQLLLDMCRGRPDAMESLNAFCPPSWSQPNGEAS